MQPTPPRQPHVFISFKTEERDSAAALKSSLEAGGFSVWWQESIQCGREWHADIDAAILTAGCIVVLWSPASIESPWVRHEASQAVARGVYTPVRLVPLEIGSPFDRLQATDLFGWRGEPNHPGLLRLLARANQLIPAPASPLRKAWSFGRRNRVALVAAAIAVAAVGMLVRLSIGLNMQLEALERMLNPLENFYVWAYLTVDPTTPGVAEYLARLREAIPLPQSGTLPAGTTLPKGVYAGRLASVSGAIEALSIDFGSELWPNDMIDSWLGTVTQFPELRIGFSRAGTAAADTPDLEFKVGAHDPDGSEGQRNTASIEWELATGNLNLRFSDGASKQSWRANGQITSIPDLATSVVRLEITSDTYSQSIQDQEAVEGTKASRQKLKLSTVFIDVSGRSVMIRTSRMEATISDAGMPAYVGDFSRVGEKL